MPAAPWSCCSSGVIAGRCGILDRHRAAAKWLLPGRRRKLENDTSCDMRCRAIWLRTFQNSMMMPTKVLARMTKLVSLSSRYRKMMTCAARNAVS